MDKTTADRPLTPLQAAVVRYVAEYRAVYGYGPSREEIEAATGASAPIVQRLIYRDVLQTRPGIHRTIRVNPDAPPLDERPE